MLRFSYARTTDLDQAVAAASEADTAFLAGGTELLNWLRLGIAAPRRILDINGLAGLDHIEPLAERGLRIGALVRLASPRSMFVVNRVDSLGVCPTRTGTNQRATMSLTTSIRLNMNWLSPANGKP